MQTLNDIDVNVNESSKLINKTKKPELINANKPKYKSYCCSDCMSCFCEVVGLVACCLSVS